MLNKIKSIALLIAIIAVSVLAVILRSRAYRPAIRESRTRADAIRENAGSAREENNTAREITEDIRSDNKSARTGIQSALEILRAAKDKADNP